MAVKKTEQLAIDYTARDFSSIRDELTAYVKRYYPDSYKDFNEASFGSMILDIVSYVGDMLSFYLDYQANETFLQTSLEFNNILKIAKQMGYSYDGAPTSHGEVSFYVLVPANPVGSGPDTRYYPVVKRGTVVGTGASVFTLAQDVNFQASTDVVVGTVDDTTGIPLTYAVKQTGRVISGDLDIQEIDIGSYEDFRKVEIAGGRSISEIVTVFDSNGNQYFEVDYLSQDVIYKEIRNPNTSTSTTAPAIFKPVSVPRRFVVERDLTRLFLQFGHGSESEIKTDPISEPNKTVLNLHGRDYVTDSTFDPSNLVSNDKLGVSPANTTLTVVYRKNNSNILNAPVGTINQIISPKVQFEDSSKLSIVQINTVRDSLECTNEEPLVGDNLNVTIEEVKQRAYGSFYSQNRAVTLQDYKTTVYNMPQRFGSVSRCMVLPDNDSFKRNLNLYIISKDLDGNFTQSNSTIKENLKFWVNKHRMINDLVDILDGRVVNLGIIFEVLSENNVNKQTVFQRCIRALRNLYSTKPDMGEPVVITKIYKKLNAVVGVADVRNIKIIQKVGTNYSNASFDIEKNYSADRRYLSIPADVVYEFKFPDSDFTGVIL